MSDIVIRRYTSRDRRAILDITTGSFGGACLESAMEESFGAIAGQSWQERKRKGIDYELRRHADHILVAECDGAVVGYVCNRVYVEVATGHIANMAVHTDYQGRGVGKALIRASLEHFRQHGMRYARIETMDRNLKGKTLYPAFGFKEIGRQIYFLREL